MWIWIYFIFFHWATQCVFGASCDIYLLWGMVDDSLKHFFSWLKKKKFKLKNKKNWKKRNWMNGIQWKWIEWKKCACFILWTVRQLCHMIEAILSGFSWLICSFCQIWKQIRSILIATDQLMPIKTIPRSRNLNFFWSQVTTSIEMYVVSSVETKRHENENSQFQWIELTQKCRLVIKNG